MNNLFLNIDYMGMLCLGCFVGGVLNYGITQIKDTDSFSKSITLIFSAAFTGTVFVFLGFVFEPYETGSKTIDVRSIFMYPLGLLLALLWLQVPYTIENRIKSKHRGINVIGWVHLIAVSSLTLGLAYGLFFTGRINPL